MALVVRHGPNSFVDLSCPICFQSDYDRSIGVEYELTSLYPNASQTQDNFYALIFATSPCTVTLSTPPSAGSLSNVASQSFSVPAGVTRLSQPLVVGSTMSVKLSRNGVDVVNYTPPGYQFVQNPPSYNFNYKYYSS
jgi:hypothetical protein